MLRGQYYSGLNHCLAQAPAALLLIQVLADTLGKAVDHIPSAWVPATHGRDLYGMHVSAWPSLGCYSNLGSKSVDGSTFCLHLSLFVCSSVLQINKVLKQCGASVVATTC